MRAHSPDTAIIWMTAFGSYSVAAEAEELRVDSCLDKPVKIDRIREAVRDALERRRQQLSVSEMRQPEASRAANDD